MVEEVYEDEEPGRRWWLWLLILLAVLAIAIGAYLLLKPEQLTVPDVIDRESNTASQILQNRGFEVDIVPVVDADVSATTWRRQDPRPNTTAPRGLDRHPAGVERAGRGRRPDGRRQHHDEAEAALQQGGPAVQDRALRTPTRSKSGRVIDSSPAEGTTVERGSTVTLRVSRGPEQVEVPDLVGQTEEDARSALESAGLRVGKVTEEESAEDPDTVLEQSPAAGDEVDTDTAVDITVARPTPVPDVVDLTEEEATAELEDAGFEVRVQGP